MLLVLLLLKLQQLLLQQELVHLLLPVVLVLLVLLCTDLINSWRKATPADAPNRFVINIQPTQSQEFLQTLDEAGVTKRDWYPMIRGRLVAINALLKNLAGRWPEPDATAAAPAGK